MRVPPTPFRPRHALLLLAAVTACGDDGVTILPCEDDTDSVEATVDVGESVVFDWNPPCAMLLVLVEAENGDVWWIEPVGGSDGIEPPVTYGVEPAGSQGIDPQPLVVGETYDLVLWREMPSGAEQLMEVKAFVR